jgi:hypothetical protein
MARSPRFRAQPKWQGRYLTNVPLDQDDRSLLEQLAQRDETTLSAILRRGIHLYAEHQPPAAVAVENVPALARRGRSMLPS